MYNMIIADGPYSLFFGSYHKDIRIKSLLNIFGLGPNLGTESFFI